MRGSGGGIDPRHGIDPGGGIDPSRGIDPRLGIDPRHGIGRVGEPLKVGKSGCPVAGTRISAADGGSIGLIMGR